MKDIQEPKAVEGVGGGWKGVTGSKKWGNGKRRREGAGDRRNQRERRMEGWRMSASPIRDGLKEKYKHANKQSVKKEEMRS